MNKLFKNLVIVIGILIYVSCNNNDLENVKCDYNFQMLMNYDSLLVKLSSNNDTFDVEDKIGDNDKYSKGIYRFDENKRLRFYAFYIDDYFYKYSEEYNENGELIHHEGNTLLEYRLVKGINDSVIFNGFISSLKKEYKSIEVYLNNKDTLIIKYLYKSDLYSNVKCFSYKYKVDNDLNIITKMSFQSNCSNKNYTLFDTTFIPISNIY